VVAHAEDASAEGKVFDFDLVVIGGGSGGLACSKEASKCGANVCVLDFVKPSWVGTRWGLGGTCVNVGCIPKKLMHRAAIYGEETKDLPFFGWMPTTMPADMSQPPIHSDWDTLVRNVQDHIASLNYGYKSELRDHAITYKNALGSIKGGGDDAHTIVVKDKQGKTSEITAKNIVIAVGGRPHTLGCPGEEFALSSDDIFSLEHPPGDTLIVGAGYIALETAGFLLGLGFKVTLMVRSILLRGFDRECVVMIEKDLVRRGLKILPHCTPDKVELLEPVEEGEPTTGKKKRVTWTDEDGKSQSAEFDTVFAAIGRAPDSKALGLDEAGVALAKNGKIVCENEQTSLPHVYAIGDVVYGKPELTPVAIKAGRLLARRLFGGSSQGFDYKAIATTIFTPLEYGVVGLSEEDAMEKLGEENVDAFLSKYKPLEWTLNYHRGEEMAFAKVIVDLRTDEVVGLHYVGPNAGEVTQGFGAAIRMGLTYQALRDTVGIHPTCAEEFTTLEVSRSSGAPIEKGSC
jgi:thioredoxin reductase (NADPH)